MSISALVSQICNSATVAKNISFPLNVCSQRYVTFTALPEILLRAATQSLVRAANALRVAEEVNRIL